MLKQQTPPGKLEFASLVVVIYSGDSFLPEWPPCPNKILLLLLIWIFLSINKWFYCLTGIEFNSIRYNNFILLNSEYIGKCFSFSEAFLFAF